MERFDSIKEHMVQNGEEQDDCLHRKLFPVNIRLYKSDDDDMECPHCEREFKMHRDVAVTYCTERKEM